MDESKKTNRLRGPEFATRYLSGRVIDIGAGRDLVCEWAEGFDVEHGDANQILHYRATETYDTVHSSHCLEHMTQPVDALNQWWQLVKPGGHLVLVVPDEDLYEQGFWPSRFNHDHKATFTLQTGHRWSPVSHNILELVSALPNAQVIACELHDQHYDRALQTHYPPPAIEPLPWSVRLQRKCLKKMPWLRKTALRDLDKQIHQRFHVPIDQTNWEALAQIQIIARKKASP